MDEDGRHRDEHEDSQHRHVEDEQVKVLVVVEADAIVEPRAKVVHLEHAPPEHLAKVRAVGLVDVGLRLAADAPRAVVLHLERVQLRDERARLGVLRADDPRVGMRPGSVKTARTKAIMPSAKMELKAIVYATPWLRVPTAAGGLFSSSARMSYT